MIDFHAMSAAEREALLRAQPDFAAAMEDEPPVEQAMTVDEIRERLGLT